MFLIGFPLLVVPFAIYNMIAFLLPGVEWSHEMATIRLMSGAFWLPGAECAPEVAAIRLMAGADWSLTPGDVLVAGAIAILFFEMLKSTRLAPRTIVDHLRAGARFG